MLEIIKFKNKKLLFQTENGFSPLHIGLRPYCKQCLTGPGSTKTGMADYREGGREAGFGAQQDLQAF